MQSPKSRLSRLTDILLQLQSKRLVTATFLADKFEVSVRTIYRDIRSLEQSGVPIVVEEGKGYMLMDGYQLPPIMFSEEEANALITAEQLIIKNKDESLVSEYQNAIAKIKSVLKNSQKGKANLLADRIYIGGNNTYEKSSNYLMKIQSAITNFQIVEIDYCSSENKSTKRNIEPFALYSTNGNWLLVAFCRLRNEFRIFRIDYIKKLIVQIETFPPHNMTIEQYFEKYVKK